MLEVCRERSVGGSVTFVEQLSDLAAADRDHRLDRDHQTGLELLAAASLANIENGGIFVQCTPDPVAGQPFDDRKFIFLRYFFYNRPDIAEVLPGFATFIAAVSASSATAISFLACAPTSPTATVIAASR